ncbi:MAG: glycoside hydrolase family 3 N-terminal domain-containing protein [Odoribacter sp.]
MMWADTLPRLGQSSLEEVVRAMTTDEKICLLTGTGEVTEDIWVAVGETDKIVPGAAGTTFPIPRLGIPAIVMADGPAGLRISPYRDSSEQSYYCTAFPVATLLAATWNTELVEFVGDAMGNEVLEYGCDVLLAPALNIQRNPICGRNFEYYSEDPFLTGKIATAMVKGVQRNGVGTSVKHFAVNNQETNRIANDAVISPRALREIYLKGFERVIKEAQPWTVMSSYNKINGVYTSESKDLLTTILRDEWGYQGMVVTDWFGGRNAAAQVYAGNDLLMPGKVRQQDTIREALKSGRLSMEEVDRNVKRVLELILKTPRFKNYHYSDAPDLKKHATITRKAAVEGMVLLRNEKGTLPLAAGVRHIAVFGNTSYRFSAGGTGSGDVEEAYTISLEEGLTGAGYRLDAELKKQYEAYIKAEQDKIDKKKYNHITPPRIAEWKLTDELIRRKAEVSDIAIVTLGRNAGEYTDRKVVDDFNLCSDEQEMLEKVSRIFRKAGKRVVVIMNVGGVIETASWKEKADAILLAWQAGQEGGHSVADLLSGQENPSGRLPMTFPLHYEDAASSHNFPVIAGQEAVDIYREFYTGPKGADRRNIDYTLYEEGIFVGYRYFDKFKVNVSYPFGYGLSYTKFDYKDPVVKKTADGYEMSCQIINTGKCAGKEVVQLYLAAPAKTMVKPCKELKAFAKTRLLEPGESETVSFLIPTFELASFDEQAHCWAVESGSYQALWSVSSGDCRKQLHFTVDQNSETEQVHRVLLPVRALEEKK